MSGKEFATTFGIAIIAAGVLLGVAKKAGWI